MYVVGGDNDTNANNGKAIIVIYDIFGMNSGRIKGLCDQYASEGYYVVMPDVLEGFSATTHEGREWMKGFSWARISEKLQGSAYKHLAEKKITSMGAIGFCFGAWVVFHMSSGSELKCGASFHPSIGAGPRYFGEVETDIVNAVQCPQLVCPAGNDPENIQPGGELTQILAAKPFGGKCEFQAYKAQQHGFMVRGDIANAEIAKDVKDGLERSIAFFKANL